MVNVTLFSQIIHHLDRNILRKVVEKYQTDKHNKGINSWTHLVTMLFCHLLKSQSIREITNWLLSITRNLSHLGVQSKSPSKSSEKKDLLAGQHDNQSMPESIWLGKIQTGERSNKTPYNAWLRRLFTKIHIYHRMKKIRCKTHPEYANAEQISNIIRQRL